MFHFLRNFLPPQISLLVSLLFKTGEPACFPFRTRQKNKTTHACSRYVHSYRRRTDHQFEPHSPRVCMQYPFPNSRRTNHQFEPHSPRACMQYRNISSQTVCVYRLIFTPHASKLRIYLYTRFPLPKLSNDTRFSVSDCSLFGGRAMPTETPTHNMPGA